MHFVREQNDEVVGVLPCADEPGIDGRPRLRPALGVLSAAFHRDYEAQHEDGG